MSKLLTVLTGTRFGGGDEQFASALAVVHQVRKDIEAIAILLVGFLAADAIDDEQMVLHDLGALSVLLSGQVDGDGLMEIVMYDARQTFSSKTMMERPVSASPSLLIFIVIPMELRGTE